MHKVTDFADTGRGRKALGNKVMFKQVGNLSDISLSVSYPSTYVMYQGSYKNSYKRKEA